MAGGHLPTPQAPGLGSTSADGNMISTECLSSQWGLFITSDTEGFKDRANITINTNSTKHHRKEDYKSLVVFSRSSVVLFTNCRVFSVNFFFFFLQKEWWSNVSEAIQTLLLRASWGTQIPASMGINSSSSTLLSPCLFRYHLPHPAVSPGEPIRKLFISWVSLFRSHVCTLLSLCWYHVSIWNNLSLNLPLPKIF